MVISIFLSLIKDLDPDLISYLSSFVSFLQLSITSGLVIINNLSNLTTQIITFFDILFSTGLAPNQKLDLFPTLGINKSKVESILTKIE